MNRIFAWTVVLLFFAFIAPAAIAQSDEDTVVWNDLATRAEQAVENKVGSDSYLSALRAEIANWRSVFQSSQSLNSARIATLREQLAAIPAPEEGNAEPPEISQRRVELEDQLKRLALPVQQANEAFQRADGIVRELDTIIRDRQTAALLYWTASPLDPRQWGGAFAEVWGSIKATGTGVQTAWQSPTNRSLARDQLPLILLYLLLAFGLVTQAPKWSAAFAHRLENDQNAAASGFLGFMVSLGQVLFPWVGVLLLSYALRATGFFGPRGALLLDLLPWIAVQVFAVRWLAGRLFPIDETLPCAIGIDPSRRPAARRYTLILGVLIAIRTLVEGFAELDRYAADSSSVLFFLLVLIAAILIYRLGLIFRSSTPDETGDVAEQPTSYLKITGRIVQTVAVLAAILAIVGYSAAATAIIFPFILSLGLLATISVLQEAVRDFVAWISTNPEQSRDGLLPVFINFALVLASLPILALIWGARITDLTELWTRFRAGIAIGETVISPGAFVTFIVLFVIGYFVTRLVQRLLKSNVLPKTRIDTGGQNAIVSGLGYVGIFLSALIAISTAGIDLSSLAIVAGALSVGIGFGLQNIVSNFVSGIILLIERPVSQGDWIEVGGMMGTVRDISVRSTRIETFDRTDVIIPNADLISGAVTNYTRFNNVGRIIIRVGVAYGTDTRKVEAMLKEIASAHPMVLLNPEPSVVLGGFGADSLDFEIRIILRDVNFSLSVKSEIHHQIVERFAAEGIEIPFAQRDMWIRNPDALGQN